mmetsp:Transcript_12233/g.29971  ORF Transcript_12233/g.29971 Transcript_12233/m.29971 type:complete len:139 (-) Transcript_12233:53-469(-)
MATPPHHAPHPGNCHNCTRPADFLHHTTLLPTGTADDAAAPWPQGYCSPECFWSAQLDAGGERRARDDGRRSMTIGEARLPERSEPRKVGNWRPAGSASAARRKRQAASPTSVVDNAMFEFHEAEGYFKRTKARIVMR